MLIRYAETLPVSANLRRYRLPLDYARDLAGFTLRVLVRAPEQAPALAGTQPRGLAFKTRGVDYEAEVSHKDFAARGVLEVHIPVSSRPEVHTQIFNGSNYFVAEVPARLSETRLRNVPPVVAIVWDASGSGAARDYAREFALLDTYFKRLGNNGNGEARLTRVRDAAKPVERFRISNGDWSALKRALETTPYDGATQLGVFTPESGVGEYLLFSDGLDNFGERPLGKLEVPLYTVSAATRADPARLRQLAEAGASKFIDLVSTTPADAARALLYHEARIVSLDGSGVTQLTAQLHTANNRRWLIAGQAKLAIPILARVLELAPNEPQSYRDLGLAFAADKQWQKAADQLYEVVIRPWHGRFPKIELTALDELNAIIAKAETPVDTSRFDAQLLRNLPVDLRVALSWDADNTDIDLWVTDLNGEKAYYGNRISYQGGRMSQDYTGGYGPETFALKHAKPGKYKVEANFYGHNQQIVAGATTLQLNSPRASARVKRRNKR